MNDEDELARPLDADLSAWQPPPPPGGIADAVVARMRAPANVAAIEADEPRARRWMWIGGGAAVLAAAAVLLAVFGVTRGPGSGRGQVVADKPAMLDLGPSSAVLDPGAQVIWERRNHRITAEQRRGVATWRVDDDDTLLIDAGATVASVEATGASLRVEVHMNRTDAKVIGASALTAAAVAAVTVIVYEGHVRVTSKGQTVQIVPGTTVELSPDGPPREQFNVGASPEVRALEARVAELEARLADSEDDEIEDDEADDDVAAEDELDYMLNGLVDDELEKVMRVVRDVHPKAMACIDEDRSFGGTMHVSASLDRTGRVTTIAASPDNDVAGCVKAVLVAAKWPATKKPWGLESDYRFEVCDEVACVLDNYTKPCCAKFKRTSTPTDDDTPESLDRAMISKAMASIKPRIQACGFRSTFDGTMKARVRVAPGGEITKLDFDPDHAPLVDCMRGAFEKLRFPKTQNGGSFAYPYVFGSTAKNTPTQATCQDPSALDPFDRRPPCKTPTASCDAADLLQKGTEAFTMAAHARAHQFFSESYECKASAEVAQRAYIAACRMKSVVNARKWWRRMSAAQQQTVISVCPRDGISNDDVQN